MQYKADTVRRGAVWRSLVVYPPPYTPLHPYTPTHRYPHSLTYPVSPFPTARDNLYKVQQEKKKSPTSTNMSLERCPNEILFMVASYLKPEDMSSFLQANHRLANLLTPDFAKILSARRYPNRAKRLRKEYKLKRRMVAGWARRQKALCACRRRCVKRRGRCGRGACGSVPRGGKRVEPSMSSSPATPVPPPTDQNEGPPTVNGAHSAGGSRPVNRGVYAGVNKPLPKVRHRTRHQALLIKSTRGSPEM